MLNDELLYESAIDVIDHNMAHLRKKQIRDLLLFKTD